MFWGRLSVFLVIFGPGSGLDFDLRGHLPEFGTLLLEVIGWHDRARAGLGQPVLAADHAKQGCAQHRKACQSAMRHELPP